MDIEDLVDFLIRESGMDICVIKASGKRRSYVEYFVIVSGVSTRHRRAMAKNLEQLVSRQTVKAFSFHFEYFKCVLLHRFKTKLITKLLFRKQSFVRASCTTSYAPTSWHCVTSRTQNITLVITIKYDGQGSMSMSTFWWPTYAGWWNLPKHSQITAQSWIWPEIQTRNLVNFTGKTKKKLKTDVL